MALDVRMFTVGPVQENCFLFRRDGSDQALIVDPAASMRIGEIINESARYNIQVVEDTFRILGKIVTGALSAKGALAGPIEIAAQSGQAARSGFKYLLHLMGFISISIAIMNLMPIPILDGGQIFILMVEGVIRRDLSLRLKEIISQVGFVMILLLMFVVIWFDLMKNLPSTKALPMGSRISSRGANLNCRIM